jgi:hypothetical protein
MTLDIEKLKALALAARDQGAWPFHEIAFRKAADPTAVLALIAEVERLRAAQAGAEKDVERYGAIRRGEVYIEPNDDCNEIYVAGDRGVYTKTPDEFDSAIDAAIEAYVKAGAPPCGS